MRYRRWMRLTGMICCLLPGLFQSAISLQAQTESVLHAFTGGVDGGQPQAGLILDNQGNLYGTTFSGGSNKGGTVFKLTPSGQYTVLYSFCGALNCADGVSPAAGLVSDTTGSLYGTTSNEGSSGQGTVFEVAQNGSETVLHSFTGYPDDGAIPVAGLILDAKGSLYGTTEGGGAYGEGTVFQVTQDGTEMVLYNFTGGVDGGVPLGNLVQDAQGNLYGMTWTGGTSICNDNFGFGCGVLFDITQDGTERVLYSFGAYQDDARRPRDGLLLDAQGNFYGTTRYGGDVPGCYLGRYEEGCGTVFEITQNGTETVLHSFGRHPSIYPRSDGSAPVANVIRDAQGDLYGTTAGGGTYGYGTVFVVLPTGDEKLLWRFRGGADGASPFASVIQDTQGNLYGTTEGGGAYGVGTVFKVSP